MYFLVLKLQEYHHHLCASCRHFFITLCRVTSLVVEGSSIVLYLHSYFLHYCCRTHIRYFCLKMQTLRYQGFIEVLLSSSHRAQVHFHQGSQTHSCSGFTNKTAALLSLAHPGENWFRREEMTHTHTHAHTQAHTNSIYMQIRSHHNPSHT